MPILQSDFNMHLQDFKEYLMMDQPGFEKNDPAYGYLYT
jgi:hypothetical protein